MRTGADCRDLSEAVALAVALMIDLPAPSAATPPPAPRPWTVGVHAGARLGMGWLPGVAPGLAGGLSLAAPFPVEARVEAQVWPAATATGPGGRGDFSALEADLSLCTGLLRTDRRKLAVCAGAGMAWLHAEGAGLVPSREVRSRRVRFHGAVHFAIALSRRMRLALAVGAEAPLVREEFVYADDMGETRILHRSWPLAPYVALGAEIDLVTIGP